MGSNQSKPVDDEKRDGGKKGKQPTNEKTPPTVVVDDGTTNTGGFQSVPMTPITPVTPSNMITAGRPTASTPPQVHVNIHELEGHSNVSRPPPPRRVRHLSELIDPNDLPRDFHTRSPSGNILGVEEFAAHPDRPKSLRERREEVLKRVRAQSLGAEDASAGNGEGGSAVPPVPAVSGSAAGVENVKPAAEGGTKNVKFVKGDKKKKAKQAAKEKKIRAAAREKKAKAAAKDRKAKAAVREKKRKVARKEKMKKLKADRKKKEKARATAKKEKEAKLKGEKKAMKKAAAKKQPWWKRCFCC